MTRAGSHDRRALGWMLLGGGLLMVLFWTLYVSGLVDLGQHEPVIAAFESAFVLADTLLGALLLLSGWRLLRGGASGPFLMVVAAAMSLYLGLLDLAFYAGVGLYSSFSGAAVLELALNGICIVGGAWCLRVGWHVWRGRSEERREEPTVFRLPEATDDQRWIGGAA